MSSSTVPALFDVLVVEDDDDLRNTLVGLLREHGFAVEGACNGKEAIAKLAAAEPKLILLDMLMPVMNGWDLLTWLDRAPRVAAIPRVITTWLRHTPLPSGCTLLTKPLHLDKLLSAVRENIARGPVAMRQASA